MDFGLSEKIAIVTGAGLGIGRATAIQLALEGSNIVVNDLDESNGLETTEMIRDLGVKSHFIKGDVSDESFVISLFQEAYECFGAIDILINNAGISPKLQFTEITGEMFDKVLSINLKSNFMCSREAYKYMKKSGWGRIVSLSSLAGVMGGINSAAHYSASKAGIIGLTKTLAKQMGPYGITVNCVAPGRIQTAMTEMLTEEKKSEALSKIPLKRFGTVNEVAQVIVFLASECGSYITGTNIEIFGGYTG